MRDGGYLAHARSLDTRHHTGVRDADARPHCRVRGGARLRLARARTLRFVAMPAAPHAEPG